MYNLFNFSFEKKEKNYNLSSQKCMSRVYGLTYFQSMIHPKYPIMVQFIPKQQFNLLLNHGSGYYEIIFQPITKSWFDLLRNHGSSY